MFASEAKPTQNNTRDSLRTLLGVNLGTGHKTFESAGFPPKKTKKKTSDVCSKQTADSGM